MRQYRAKKKGKSISEDSDPIHINLKSFLENEISHCTDCQNSPSVFIIVKEKRYGICVSHWDILGSSDAEWGESLNEEAERS